jgi:hypothetical protein
MDPTLPRRVPGQGDCPPGYRPGSYPGQQPGSSACFPIGKNVPPGGWKPSAPASGPGYPPTASDAYEALRATIWGEGPTGFRDNYREWLKRMAR